MAFQLVMATDDEIIVWHTDFGHIFRFVVDEPRRDLVALWARDVPEAEERADSLQADALSYAIEQARTRRLIP